MECTIQNSDYVGKRIDQVLPLLDSSLTRSQVQKLIKLKQLLVNDQNVKANYLVKFADHIVLKTKVNSELKPENIPLAIIYEDDDLLVINKPRGLVVHPGNGNHEHTLVNALLYHVKNLSSIDASRPGIVHRIDKDTSGLLVVAKTNAAHRALAKQLENHTMHREYLALVKGVINENSGTIIGPIGRDKTNPLKMTVDPKNGKEAETTFKVVERLNEATLVEAKLKQGRTHQIRVHFNHIHHPVIGDLVYGHLNRDRVKDGQILHAYQITFIHPRTQKEITFKAPVPEYFKKAVKLYR
ncbi:MAG: RluA family pseudouridine synthase [Bacilli bacterium]|nr:RluA family pseudouridine synthase [Bacilli bacterium]